MSRRALVVTATLLVACAPLLGGLDEGTARTPGDAGVDAAESTPVCRTLAGYTYRIPLRIEHHGPAIRGYQVKLVFPSSDLVANGHMRPDGADIALTLADGTTRVPHWLQGRVGTETTTVWARFDLEEAPVDAWLYYGARDATDTSSASDTFVEAMIENPNFDRDTGWAPFADHLGASTSSHQWSVEITERKAKLYFSTDAHPNGYGLGLCTQLSYGDGAFRLVFDYELLVSERAAASITFASTETPVLWSTQSENIIAPAQQRNIETVPFMLGGSLLCLEGHAAGSIEATALLVSFTGLRLRRWLDGDRVAQVVGSEQVPCAQ